jgi:biotin-dependent carboxylase-like uncharacterized protein
VTPTLRVLATGPLCLVEDLGRPGSSGIGVVRSGAADRAALRNANRLLGNPEGAAALEVTLGGLRLEVLGAHTWVAVTGAPCPVRVDGREVGTYGVLPLAPGEVLQLGTPARGLRSYVAVRGGLDVPAVLGSRSHDVLSRLGPPPPAVGDELPVGRPPEAFPEVDVLAPPAFPADVVLRAVRGPRDTWVRDVDALVRTAWTASQRSNRVGMWLAGGVVAHREGRPQLPSEGAYRGAVQVPPSGEPVLLLADHPVTGGYPVVAVVVDADVDLAAQVRPGQPLRFRWVRP